MVHGIDDRFFCEAFEKGVFELVEAYGVAISEKSALAVAMNLLGYDVVVIVAPHEKAHAHVGGHQYFVHKYIVVFLYFNVFNPNRSLNRLGFSFYFEPYGSSWLHVFDSECGLANLCFQNLDVFTWAVTRLCLC